MTKELPRTDSRAILTDLLEPGEAEGAGYLSLSDLAALVEHQLRTPLALEAPELQKWAPRGTDVAGLVRESPLTTYGDVLARAEAGDPLLKLVKQQAKGMLAGGELPAPVARFLYVASILRAHRVNDATVSSMDEASLRSEGRRLLTEHWLPDEAKNLVRAGLDG